MVKDVHNASLRHIRLTEQDKKPVTNARDTQEVDAHQGRLVLNVFQQYKSATSLLDDFDFYAKRELVRANVRVAKTLARTKPTVTYGNNGGGHEYRNDACLGGGRGVSNYPEGSANYLGNDYHGNTRGNPRSVHPNSHNPRYPKFTPSRVYPWPPLFRGVPVPGEFGVEVPEALQSQTVCPYALPASRRRNRGRCAPRRLPSRRPRRGQTTKTQAVTTTATSRLKMRIRGWVLVRQLGAGKPRARRGEAAWEGAGRRGTPKTTRFLMKIAFFESCAAFFSHVSFRLITSPARSPRAWVVTAAAAAAVAVGVEEAEGIPVMTAPRCLEVCARKSKPRRRRSARPDSKTAISERGAVLAASPCGAATAAAAAAAGAAQAAEAPPWTARHSASSRRTEKGLSGSSGVTGRAGSRPGTLRAAAAVALRKEMEKPRVGTRETESEIRAVMTKTRTLK